jgi:hypothetical protein
MFREKGSNLSGVLNDYDMAVSVGREEGQSSRQRTGTKPFLAIGLLLPIPQIHAYWHDLESLSYCLLWTIVKRVEDPLEKERGRHLLIHPLKVWEGLTYSSLLDKKRSMFGGNLPSSYRVFRQLFRKCADLQDLITLYARAWLHHTQSLIFYYEDLKDKIGSGIKHPVQPGQLTFNDCIESLDDAVIFGLVGSRENASYDYQLAERFNVGPLPPYDQQA